MKYTEKIKVRLELLDRGPHVNKGKLMQNAFDIWTVMPINIVGHTARPHHSKKNYHRAASV